MNRKALAWLYAELPILVRDGVLSPEGAEALRRRYGPLDDPGGGRVLRIVLAAFGALLVGGGILLILAHNWEDLSRPLRAGLAIGLLLAAQGLGLHTFLRRRDQPAWVEVSGAFWLTSVGACIALVSQTYHLESDLESFYRVWMWLVLPVPYLLGSRVAAIGFFALVVARSFEWHGWRSDLPVDLWLSAMLGLPFAWNEVRRRGSEWATALVVLAAAAALAVVGLTVSFEDRWKAMTILFSTALFAALYGIASVPGAPPGPWRGRLRGPAWLALIVTGLVLSFDGSPWSPIEPLPRGADGVGPGSWLTGVAAVAWLAVASLAALRLLRDRLPADGAWACGGLVGASGVTLALAGHDVAAAALVNVWLLASGSLALRSGLRRGSLGEANRGLFALAALAAVRFFDTDLGFLVRGVGFVVLGLAFLGTNLWLLRRGREGRS